MASFAPYCGRDLCAAIVFISASLQSIVTASRSVPSLLLRLYTRSIREKPLRRSCVLRCLLATVLGPLILILLFPFDSVNATGPPIEAQRLVLLPCAYTFFRLFAQNVRIQWRYPTRHLKPSTVASFLFRYARNPSFPSRRSQLISLLLLLAPQVLLAEPVMYIPLYNLLYITPATRARTSTSPSAASVPLCSFLRGAANCVNEFHGERLHFSCGVLRSTTASVMVATHSPQRVTTLAPGKEAEPSTKPCTQLSFRRRRTNRPGTFASYRYDRSGRDSKAYGCATHCRVSNLQCSSNRQIPTTSAFFTFSVGHTHPPGAVAGSSTTSRYPHMLLALQTTRDVVSRSLSATAIPKTKHLYIFSRVNKASAEGPRPCTWLRHQRRGAHEHRCVPVAFRLPCESSLACFATAGSRPRELLDEIKKLTIVEVAELVSLIEQSFGIQGVRAGAADLVDQRAISGGNGADGHQGAEQAKPVEKKTAFSVEIKAVPLEKRIGVIKTLRTVRPDLGLKDAKGLIDTLPSTILSNISKEKAEEAQKILADAGAQVEIK